MTLYLFVVVGRRGMTVASELVTVVDVESASV